MMADRLLQQAVKLEREGDVAIIRLNEPETMNALSSSVVELLMRALDEAFADARSIVITGEGRAFCSGANLRTEVNFDTQDYDAGAELDRLFNPLMLKLRDSPLPILTAVNGAAAGLGAAIALAGDIIIASRSAYFLLPFRNIGLVPDGGTASLLLASAGRARAMEMMLLAERVPAETALEWDMINRVVDADALDGAVLAIAARLAAGPTLVLGMIRKLAWAAMDMDYEAMLTHERHLQRSAGLTADHREGVEAFLAKRPVRFAGR
jgi:2-(1,2-epoxy-1,2-dihydrophenyl)acetyl-CoA isomerase